MNGRHFAIFTQLGNGHVYPTLSLCRELVRRGHRVTYATNDHYSPMIVATGAEPVVLRNMRLPDDIKEKVRHGRGLPITDPRSQAAFRSWRSYALADAAALLPQIQSVYKNDAPDLVLYDHYHIPGRLFAKMWNIPTVQISAHFAYYNGLALRRNGISENPEALIEWSHDVDSFYMKYGIYSRGSFWHLEKLNIYFIPKEFQHNCESFDDRFCFVGSMFDRPFRHIWKDCSNGKPIILISGLSQFKGMGASGLRDFDIFTAALSESPYHCILSIGDEDFDRDIPPNFEINRHASHLEILPHAALSLCHGGTGSTLEAIYNAAPPLMVPQTEFCDEVAYRAEELGIGVRLPRAELSVENVKNTIARMLDDTDLKNRVIGMREVFMRSGGAKMAADRIEGCVA